MVDTHIKLCLDYYESVVTHNFCGGRINLILEYLQLVCPRWCCGKYLFLVIRRS
jgi:hypothetical protein